jgi:hypothetical protein
MLPINMQNMLFFYSKLLIQLYWITYYVGSLTAGLYNTHDCHTILSLFLAIAIRAVNHPHLKMVITLMCHFFNALSKKVIDFSELDEICKEIRVIMC